MVSILPASKDAEMLIIAVKQHASIELDKQTDL